MLRRLTELLIKKARKREVTLSPELTSADLASWLTHKAIFPTLRGLFRFPIRNVRGQTLMLGSQVTIIAPGKLRFGRFCVIGSHSHIDCTGIGPVSLGDRVTIREFAWLQRTSRLEEPGREITIGNGTYIGPRVILGAAAPLVIGEHCLIGADVHFIAENHRFRDPGDIGDQGVQRSGIRIGNNCWIGNGVKILDGVIVGEGAVLAAGAVVTKPVPAREVWAGVPARRLSARPSDSSAGASTN